MANQRDEDRLRFAADADVFGRRRTAMTHDSVDPLNCQTLHIVRGMPHGAQHERRLALEAAIAEFGGGIQRIWFVSDERQAFLRFKWRAQAQLVKEAFNGRPLQPDLTEPLELTWASVDPNVLQTQQAKELAFQAMVEARERAQSTHDLYARFENKGGHHGTESNTPNPVAHNSKKRLRPDASCEHSSTSTWGVEDEGALAISDVTAAYPSEEQHHEPADEARAVGVRYPVDACELPNGWKRDVDPASGVAYFYNEDLGRTQWQPPGADESRRHASWR